jgi:DNA-binding Xre family transcriptional regulator
MTIRKNVEFILRTKSMTKVELAAKMKSTPQSVTQFLDSENIGLDNIIRIAKALRVKPADLLASPPLNFKNKPHEDDGNTHTPQKFSTNAFCPSCGSKLVITIEES